MSTEVGERPAGTALGAEEAYALAEQVEAGVLARAARLDPAVPWRGDATTAELVLIEQQGERAWQRFLSANLGLVGLVVRGFGGGGGSAADLHQEGCLGLVAALQRFDHRRGLRFSTYALYWVRACVGAAAARQVGAPELPTSRAERLRSVRGQEAELTQRLGRPVTVAELAQSLGRSPAWTAALLAHRAPQPLDLLDGDTRDALLRADTEPGAAAYGWARELLDRLPGSERSVVELRLGFLDGRPWTLAETGRHLGHPVGRVRRTEQRALERLRAHCPQQVRDAL